MKTKTILAIFIFATVLLFVFSCNPFAHRNDLQIDISNVDSALIQGQDTIAFKPKRLTKTQLNSFAEKWNDCGEMKLTKYLSKFSIHLYLKDGTVLGFRCNGKAIKQKNDWTCDFDDDHYFDKLYSEAK